MLDMTALPAKAAHMSPDLLYRYYLRRSWAKGKHALWIMLNPSTADERQNDPTILRCVHFSKREGCGGLVVANLFALRATDPATLTKAPDPIGPNNDYWLRILLKNPSLDPVIVGWGAMRIAKEREEAVRSMALNLGRQPWCLGKTASGSPRHPLYLANDTPLIPWS